MGNCISWDRNKSIWALRILSEVLLCTGIVSCVAAFTIEVRFILLFIVRMITVFFAKIDLSPNHASYSHLKRRWMCHSSAPTLQVSHDHPRTTLNHSLKIVSKERFLIDINDNSSNQS